MNKRQRKKFNKKTIKKIRNIFDEVSKLFVPYKIDTRRVLMSTWDEEYPPYQTK